MLRRFGVAFALAGCLSIAAAADAAARGETVARADSGHVWALAANDAGPVAAEMPMHLTLLLERPAERQRAFATLLRQQQDPRSAEFHRWLDATQIGARFGASTEDIAAATSWLRAQGLSIDGISKSRSRIAFSGDAQTVGRAFATEIHAYSVHGEQRFAPARAPRLPSSISAVVRSIVGLGSVEEHAAHGSGGGRVSAGTTSASTPAATFCSQGSCSHYLFPADFSKIYDIDPVYQQGIDGRGQTIAIIGRARVYLPDIENFQMRAGLPTKDPTIIVPPGGLDPGAALSSGGDPPEDQLEATIDVTRATSVAPGAQIDLVVSANGSSVNGLRVASEYVVDSNPVIAQVMSISFGACEVSGGQSGVQFYDDVFSQAAAEGISVFVISGDSGAAGCDPYNATPPPNQVASSNFICVSSYATCVGGTQFADTANPSQYWNASNGSAYVSALGYIPEGAWNEPTTSNGKFQASATGGGISAYIPTPYWQTGIGVPGTQGRYTPDVSFSAAAHDGYFACLAAAGNSCVSDSTGSFRFEYFYGTSASTPDMAGVAALLNQRMGGAQGNLNQRLYALAATPANGVYHDTTPASSGVGNCDLATPSLCNNSTPGFNSLTGGLQGFALTTGYDLATGLGSIDVAKLLSSWGEVQPAVNLNQFGLTGAWYNPAKSGQGLLLQTFPDLLGAGKGVVFGGWFTFATLATSGQRWYTIQGPVDAQDASATLPIYATYGGNFNAPPKINTTQIGQATLAFSDCTHGALTYHLSQDDGTTLDGTMPLARLGSNVSCGTNGDNGNAPVGTALSGAWYDANTSGQGLLFAVDSLASNLFAAWYTFVPNGQHVGGGASQRWYTLQAGGFATGTKSIKAVPVYATTGGVFDNPTKTQVTQVGTADLTWLDCTHLGIEYSFTAGENQGASGTLTLTHAASTSAACGF